MNEWMCKVFHLVAIIWIAAWEFSPDTVRLFSMKINKMDYPVVRLKCVNSLIEMKTLSGLYCIITLIWWLSWCDWNEIFFCELLFLWEARYSDFDFPWLTQFDIKKLEFIQKKVVSKTNSSLKKNLDHATNEILKFSASLFID